MGESTFNLDLVADGDTRLLETSYSRTFLQIEPPPQYDGTTHEDGFFVIAADYPEPYDSGLFDLSLFDPTVFQTVGSGQDAFPFERDFQNDYLLSYDDAGLTSSGVETAPLTGADFDFDEDYLGAADILGRQTYETEVHSVAGEALLRDGQVEGFNAVIDLTFAFDLSDFGVGALPYDGTLTIEGRRWTLLVDGIYDATWLGAGLVRVIWDGHGFIDNLYESGLAGDYSNDGLVDSADYTVWRDLDGEREGALPNDVDGGDIGAAQRETWAAQFGGSDVAAAAGSRGVPEPSSVAVAGLFVSAMACRRRRPAPDLEGVS